MIVSTFGRYSGSHLNPALSFGKFLAGTLDCVAFLGYFAAQVFGVFVATIVNEKVLSSGGSGSFHGAVFDYGEGQAVFYEMCACVLATFGYVYVVLLCCEKTQTERSGILGFTYAFGHVISSEFNPSVPVSAWLLNLVKMGINGTGVMPAYFSVVMSPICCVVGACLAVLVKQI